MRSRHDTCSPDAQLFHTEERGERLTKTGGCMSGANRFSFSYVFYGFRLLTTRQKLWVYLATELRWHVQRFFCIRHDVKLRTGHELDELVFQEVSQH